MAWTTPRTWTDGELVTASIMNAHVRDNLRTAWHLIVRKTADEFVDSGSTGTTLQNDDHLFFAIGANETWLLKFVITHSGEASGIPNIKIAFTVPAGATLRFSTVFPDSGGTVVHHRWQTSGTSASLISPANTSIATTVIEGHVANGGTAGNVQLQWAQNTSNAENETVYTNSSIFGMLVV